MIRLNLTPHKATGKHITVMVHGYWNRSAKGFGIYTKELSEKTFRRVADNARLYYVTDEDGEKFKVKAQRVGRGYFLVIKPEDRIYPQ